MPWEPSAYDPDDFANRRHVGPSPAEMAEMLEAVGASSLDALIDETVPASIRQSEPLAWAPLTEAGLLAPKGCDAPRLEAIAEAETMVVDETQAEVLGLTILARRSQPFWSMPGIMIPFHELTNNEAAAVRGLEVSDGVLIPLPRVPGPTPSQVAQWAVEGWVEEWRADNLWMQLSVTDWARFSAAILRSYQDVLDSFTYGEVAAKTYQRVLAEVV